jgi:hypothetical protein
VSAVAAAVVAGSSFPHLQIVPCEFNIKLFSTITPVLCHQFTDSGIMAPKETKRDRERRLKAQEQEATDAPTDGPTDDEPEEPIQYNTEGVLMMPGTSAAAAAAAAATASGASAGAASNAVASTKVGTLSSSDSESDGVAREKEWSDRTGTLAAKRALARSSRSRSRAPKKKAKKWKKARMRRWKESSSSSSSGRDDRRRSSRGRSPSISASSSSSDSGDSNWEDFYANDTVI